MKKEKKVKWSDKKWSVSQEKINNERKTVPQRLKRLMKSLAD